MFQQFEFQSRWLNESHNDEKALTFTGFMRIRKLKIQKVVKTRTKRLKIYLSKHFVYAGNSINYLPDPAPVLTLFALNQDTQYIHFYNNRSQFPLVNKTKIPNVIVKIPIVHNFLNNNVVVYLL